MATVSTIYEVRTRYITEDRASSGITGIGTAARNANVGVLSLRNSMYAIGLGTAAVMAAKKAFFDFNSEVQESTIAIAAIINADIGGTFGQAESAAGDLVDKFKQFAIQTPLTTSEILEFSKAISGSVFGSGGNLNDFTTMSEKGALAAKILGANTNMAATEMGHLLQGSVSGRMIFAKNLLAMGGITDTKNFNSKVRANGQFARDTLLRIYNSSSMKEAQKRFEHSFAGVSSTFIDKLQIGLANIGMPLFQMITTEIKTWNLWIDRNTETIKKIGKSFIGGLFDIFNTVKTTISYIMENKETLLTIGKLWVGTKLAAAGGGLFKGVLDSAAGLQGSITGMITGFANVTSALATLYVGLQAFAAWVDTQHTKDIQQDANQNNMGKLIGSFVHNKRNEFMTVGSRLPSEVDKATEEKFIDPLRRSAIELLAQAKDMGALTARGKGAVGVIDVPKLVAGLQAINPGVGSEHDALIEYQKDMILMAQDMLGNDSKLTHMLFNLFGMNTNNGLDPKKRSDATSNTTINNYNRIEVTSPDPDRFAFDLVGAFNDIAKAPTQAASAISGRGF